MSDAVLCPTGQGLPGKARKALPVRPWVWMLVLVVVVEVEVVMVLKIFAIKTDLLASVVISGMKKLRSRRMAQIYLISIPQISLRLTPSFVTVNCPRISCITQNTIMQSFNQARGRFIGLVDLVVRHLDFSLLSVFRPSSF